MRPRPLCRPTIVVLKSEFFMTFTTSVNRISFYEWMMVILILVIAFFFRSYQLANVPPGIHYDEVINGQIALTAKEVGFQLFYPEGWGREGLYHWFLAGSLTLPLPVAWQFRLPSILCGLVGIALTYVWVRRAFGPWVAITAITGMAVVLWPVLMSRAALRANTLLPFVAAAACALPYTLTGKRRFPASVAFAVFLGLSFYTYRVARLLPLLYITFIFYLILWHKLRPKWLIGSLLGGLTLGIPLFLLLTQNPSLETRVGQVDGPWQALLQNDIQPIGRGLVATLNMFALRGDLQSHYNLPGLSVFEPLGAILFWSGVLIAVIKWRQPVYAFCLIWLAVALAPGIVTEPTPHFVHTILAQGVVFVFPGLTLNTLAIYLQRHPLLRWLPALLLVIWLSGNLYRTYSAYFIQWPQEEEVRRFHQATLANVAHYLDNQENILPVTICTSFLNEQDPFWRTGRQTMPFLLNRQDVSIRWYDCLHSQVWPEGGAPAYHFFLENQSPTNWDWGLWPENKDSTMVLVGDDVFGFQLEVTKSLDEHLFTLSENPQAITLPVNFDDQMSFLGWKLDQTQVRPGDTVTLLSYWRVLTPLPPEMSIFVHVLRTPTELLTQGDAFTLLSDTVRSGDVIVQQHSLIIPEGTVPGHYPLSIGVYSRLGNVPPLVIITQGEERDARLTLQELIVE